MAAAPELKEGDWLDVVDGDGIWNVAQVLRLPSAETVEVTYDCWGDEYNELLPRDSPRIAPFHTHTWAVKCWAKLDTWPWWPALLTVRAPGSDVALQNLRLEERLLVDFLDNADFAERCRSGLTKPKRRKKSKGETRSKNMALSTARLARCDAREDFPEFVEGTLPVQFEHEFTRPTEEVRKEMGEEVWLRGFADNRVNHAAAHAYTPIFAEVNKSRDGNGVVLSKSVEEKSPNKDTARNDSQLEDESRSTTDAGKDDQVVATQEPRSSDPVVAEPQKERVVNPKPKNLSKRARPNDEEENSDLTDSSRAGKAKSPRFKTGENNSTQHRNGNPIVGSIEENDAKSVSTSISPANVPHVATRKLSHGMITTPLSRLKFIIALLEPLALVMPRAQSHVPQKTKRKQLLFNVSNILMLRLTKATLRADEKLHSVEHALKDKLTELAQKSAKAEELRSKCNALNSRVRFPTLAPPEQTSPDVTSSKDVPAKESAQVSRKNSRRENKTANRSNSSREPATLARRSAQSQCGIRGLELALDDRISKLQGIDSVTTRAEFDAIKADLLNSPEVQAAITRLEHPSYGWSAPTGTSSRWTSASSSDSRLRAFEAAKSRYSGYLSATGSSERRPSPRSPSQRFCRSWGYEPENRSSSERSSSPSSSNSPRSSFGFSVNDNFSISQWYRDLYPKAFNFQEP
ncbi:PWWP domain [Phytophthora cinnamomi]|uniref:PWWP domain n=1 Tax=Phytophthora cinnamomi TaxID=4785 RepID=UPI003559C233|nr:PWWP domain [Phytophthora cinnamomi]